MTATVRSGITSSVRCSFAPLKSMSLLRSLCGQGELNEVAAWPREVVEELAEIRRLDWLQAARPILGRPFPLIGLSDEGAHRGAFAEVHEIHRDHLVDDARQLPRHAAALHLQPMFGVI